jgi:hypothetical protein
MQKIHKKLLTILKSIGKYQLINLELRNVRLAYLNLTLILQTIIVSVKNLQNSKISVKSMDRLPTLVAMIITRAVQGANSTSS